MNKVVLRVPAFLRYLSEWPGFSLTNFNGHIILHKQLPGCGFTEFALTSPENVVLCSPRKMLMENKKAQHGEEVYLVVNEYEPDADIDADISKPESVAVTERKDQYVLLKTQELADNINTLYTRLFQEIGEYITKRSLENKPAKIIVTYDSTYLVKQILTQMGIIDSFYFCIDEFQSILEDARFKSSVELEFLTILKDIKHVQYVSATPMLDKYLIRIPELAKLSYYFLDWEAEDPTRIKKPDLKVRTMNSVAGKAGEIIQSYLDGKFEKVIVDRGGWFEEVESREAVFYVNSVNHIVGIIKKMNLTSDQCNILCSNTPENQRKIDKALGKKKNFKIGSVPLKGEKHKMFTFCTRTVYLGADFYSTNARSFIFSDSNSDSLSVDISNDLNQILGRQRLDENPWKNCAEFYYRTTCDYKKKTQEQLNKEIDKKVSNSESMLRTYERSLDCDKTLTAKVYEDRAKSKKYSDDYISVNRKIGGKLIPMFNNLVLINEQRTFDIQQIDYADRFSVFCKINDKVEKSNLSTEFNNIRLFYSKYDQLTTYVDKIHMIVDFLLDNPNLQEIIIGNLVDSDKIKQQLVTLGPERIKGLGYNLTKINKAMGIKVFDQGILDNSILSHFSIGNRYQKKELKEIIGKIYEEVGYKATPKASILEDYFDVKLTKVTSNGTCMNGFEILDPKEKYKNQYELIRLGKKEE